MTPSLRSERGEGTLKTIFVLLIVGSIFGLIWQLVPAYYERYNVLQAMSDATDDATVLMNDPQIEEIILTSLKNLKLYPEHQPKNFKITRRFDPETGKDRIFLVYTYTREIGLLGTGISYPLTFTLTR